MSRQIDDTIVALATPPGVGAISVLRLSGNKAIAICNEICPPKNFDKIPSHSLHFVIIKNEEQKIIDEAVIGLFKAPHSYTGEDVIEISCHASFYIQDQIIQLCIRKGARLARPGEFTQRAFLNGKMDLTQAEAVADVIASQSSAAQQTAIKQMRGGISRELKLLREELIRFTAMIELELDFSQEDVVFADRAQLLKVIDKLDDEVQKLIHSFQLGNAVKNGISVAIVGKPNSGKSTLLNTLLNEERSIVSDIAGTTRDTIEETINMDGIIFRFIDTAGIRDHTDDVIEKIGVERSLQKMNNADIILYLFDAADEQEDIISQQKKLSAKRLKFIMAGNKIDTVNELQAQEKFSNIDHLIFISAKEKRNIDQLKKQLLSYAVNADLNTENIIITNARHHAALQEVARSLNDIKEGLHQQLSGDLLTPDIRRCLHYLGEITGEITNEDTLDYIFSKFCIGK